MATFNFLLKNFGSLCKQITRGKHYGPPQPYVHGNPINIPKSTSRKFKIRHVAHTFRRERKLKLAKIVLPNYNKSLPARINMTPAEIREELKGQGIAPEAEWGERTIYIASSQQCFEEYIPPEGDGKANLLSIEGAKQNMELLTVKGRSMMSVRKIKAYEDQFKLSDFPVEAKEVYIKMHAALCNKDWKLLHKYCTEKIYPTVTHNAKLKTIRWTLVRDLEPARVVHCRHTHLVDEDNKFAQITVRFHTQQTLAVYDRFGRLFHGSEIVARDCLEYVVFEKNISNVYGLWRVHHKIVPAWMDLKPNSMATYKIKVNAEEEVEDASPVDVESKVATGSGDAGSADSPAPALPKM